MEKIVYAGRNCTSFLAASQMLAKLADLDVEEKQVERLTRAIGEERLLERQAAVQAFQDLPLPEKFQSPAGVEAPDVATVMVDGGRLQILDRIRQKKGSAQLGSPKARAQPPQPLADPATAAPQTSDPTTQPLAEPTVTDSQTGDPTQPLAESADAEWQDEPSQVKGHWREDKIALLMTMRSEVFPDDPCPEIPECFVDALRIPQLVRALKKSVKRGEDGVRDSDSVQAEAVEEALAETPEYQAPKVVHRQVVGSRYRWPLFAPLVAARARPLGFQEAKRKAFVGDGSSNNWILHKRFFASFVAILDFIHALSYVFAGAMAGRNFVEGWAIYKQWINWTWQGQVAKVIAALQSRQAELGEPTSEDTETSPRQRVKTALTFLRNQQEKMRYNEYRKEGLPITSSHIESTVKRINQRVKGTEKLWSEEGSEAILQLRADYLSEDEPMEAFWKRRQANATGQHKHCRQADATDQRKRRRAS